MCGKLRFLGLILVAALVVAPAATGHPLSDEPWAGKLRAHDLSKGGSGGSDPVMRNFKLLGHHDLGMTEANGDVWVHRGYAYVGTWRGPCSGRGVKIVDVSDLRRPELVGTLAAREGTSAEDMVARRVSTAFFQGDLMAVGMQRCGGDPALDEQEFGVQLWDVSNPRAPAFLTELGVQQGQGGVHELDLFQRGSRVYALLATPFSEWFDLSGRGDFMIADVTNPHAPVVVSDWGAGAHSLARGPFWGQGSFGATLAHSARASADGRKAYVSYWDLGVLTFDITDPSDPVLRSRTRYEADEDGDAHSMTPYRAGNRRFILQNDEDYDPAEPAEIRYGRSGRGIGLEGIGLLGEPGGTPLWLEPGHKVTADVVEAANQGCAAADYPAGTAGKIAVVRTPFPFFDPPGGEEPLCFMGEQDQAAEAAGARAVVHDFVAENTSPQWFDFAEVGIPVVFTDHATARGMVAAGRATLQGRPPTWGFLRVYDARTGEQLTQFDRAPHVRELPAPPGTWSIHNTETLGDRAYSSWYSNGIVALDLEPLERRKPGAPRMVGQFVPPDTTEGMWGVFARRDGVVFGSDIQTGLWIVKPTGKAAPERHDDNHGRRARRR